MPAKIPDTLPELSPAPLSPSATKGLIPLGDLVRRPVAARVAAPFAFPELPKALPGLCSVDLVTAGRTVPDLSAACAAWTDMIGEEVPSDLTSLLETIVKDHPKNRVKATSPLRSNLASGDVLTQGAALEITRLARQALPVNGWLKYTAPRRIAVSSVYEKGESTLSLASYSGSVKYIGEVVVALFVLLAAPDARRASGVLAMELGKR